MFLARAALYSVVIALLVAPAAGLATRHGRGRRALALGAAFLFVDLALLLAPRFGPFAHMRYAWQGKLLSVALSAAAVRGFGGLSGVSSGVTARPAPGSLAPAFLAGLLPDSLNLLAFALGDRGSTDPETIAFELTMPGIEEELAFRGVLQSLFDEGFGRPWSVFGARVGWGWVLSSLAFLALHAFSIDAALHLRWRADPEQLAGVALAGFAFGWMRARTGSVWPGVVAHNAGNSVLPLGTLLSPA